MKPDADTYTIGPDLKLGPGLARDLGAARFGDTRALEFPAGGRLVLPPGCVVITHKGAVTVAPGTEPGWVMIWATPDTVDLILAANPGARRVDLDDYWRTLAGLLCGW